MKSNLRSLTKSCFIFCMSIYMTCGYCAISDTTAINIQTLPTPYNELDTILPYHPHGWYGNKKQIEMIFSQTKPRIVVELGSWLGLSTCHMANLLQSNGKLYAIDHWLGTYVPNRPNQAEHDSFLPTLYEQFLSNVIHQGLTHTIIPWKMTTTEASHRMRQEKISIDLIYIDAAHDEPSVYEDLSNWYPLVRKGGVICGDDWEYGAGDGYPVRRAIYHFIKENQLKLHMSSNNFWMFYKP